MRILIVIARSPVQRYLVELHTKELVEEIKRLINKRRHSQAIVSALSKGRFEREVAHHEVPYVDVDLILSENSVKWDLMKR